MKALHQETEKDLSKFGLNRRILSKHIDLSGTQINPDIYENLKLENLQNIIQDFIEKKTSKIKERVMVLLGSSGSGKSTILQLNYLNALENWKKDYPVPFFINLAVETNLKQRWKLLCKSIDQNNINFTMFSGIKQYPMTLFIDSFEETPIKINYVLKFLKD